MTDASGVTEIITESDTDDDVENASVISRARGKGWYT